MDKEKELPELPEKCPICHKTAKNLLLHISKTMSCISKIDSNLFNYWKKQQKRGSKIKYQSTYVKEGRHSKAQAKYVMKGEHSKAQAKYVKKGEHSKIQAKYVKKGEHSKAQAKYKDKFRLICNVCPREVCKQFYTGREFTMFRLKGECDCPPDRVGDRGSYLQMKRHNKSKSRNRQKIRSGQEDGKKRLEKFKNLCLECIWCLKRGKISNATYGANDGTHFNKFHLVEGETLLEYITEEGEVVLNYEDEDQDEIHSWLSEVNGTLLSHVINFQQVVLITKSKWTKLIKEANTKEDKRHLSKSIYRLIGKLQSYENKNTKDIPIPDEFKVSKAVEDQSWQKDNWEQKFEKENELLLISMLEEIVGEEHCDEELLEHLGILDDNLETALGYTKRTKD